MSLGLRNADIYEGEGRKTSAAAICYRRYSKSFSAVEQPQIRFCLPIDFVNAPSMAASTGALLAEGNVCVTATWQCWYCFISLADLALLYSVLIWIFLALGPKARV